MPLRHSSINQSAMGRSSRRFSAVCCWLAVLLGSHRIKAFLTAWNHDRSHRIPRNLPLSLLLQEDSGIQQERRTQREIITSYYRNIRRIQEHSTVSVSKHELLIPVKSYADFLANNKFGEHSDENVTSVLSRSTIHSLRLAASMNDYRLIARIMESAMSFGTVESYVLREGIRALCNTSASVGKLKKLWKSSEGFEKGPMETNAMLTGLLQHNRTRAALTLFHDSTFTDSPSTDATSFSLLLRGLTASLGSNQDTRSSKPVVRSPEIRDQLSECWQWNEALLVLDDMLHTSRDMLSTYLSNHTISSLLTLNKEARGLHNSGKNAIFIFGFLKDNSIVPDEHVCSLVISSLTSEWRVALELFEMMSKDSSAWSLPKPNEYIYSSVMTICARNQQFGSVSALLDAAHKDTNFVVNTWIYNSVLQGIVHTSQRRYNSSMQKRSRSWMVTLRNKRLKTALRLVRRMEEEGQQASPDVITYNTLLSALSQVATSLGVSDWSDIRNIGDMSVEDSVESVVHEIIDRMETRNIDRTAATYSHALQTLQGRPYSAFSSLLSRCRDDIGLCTRTCNAALSTAASSGQTDHVSRVVEVMKEFGIDLDASSYLHILTSVQDDSESVTLIIESMMNNSTSCELLKRVTGLRLDPGVMAVSPKAEHFTAALSFLLQNNDYRRGGDMIRIMQKAGIRHTSSSLQSLARSYAVKSLSVTSKLEMNPIAIAGATVFAKSAFAVVDALEDTPSSLLSTVAKACAAAHLYESSLIILARLHKRVVSQRGFEDSRAWQSLNLESVNSFEGNIPDLHRALFRSCARDGNSTFAIQLCERIQDFTMTISAKDPPHTAQRTNMSTQNLGMGASEWKSFVIACSKDGEWQTCLSAMQDFFELMHSQTGSPLRVVKTNHRRLSVALLATIKTLVAHKQYAWCLKLLETWIDRGNFRPPRQGIIATVRLLVGFGRVDESMVLIEKCLGTKCFGPSEADNDTRLLYVGCIAALHHQGHYEEADQLFVQATGTKIIPFHLYEPNDSEDFVVLDLHGMNIALAHAAVRLSLTRLFLSANRQQENHKLFRIVTGRGINSSLRLRPVLRPEVQRMLTEEFYPPLGTSSVPGNLGALEIPSCDIEAWLAYQEEQKGFKMLSIASALKSITSPGRLGAALAKVSTSNQKRGSEAPR